MILEPQISSGMSRRSLWRGSVEDRALNIPRSIKRKNARLVRSLLRILIFGFVFMVAYSAFAQVPSGKATLPMGISVQFDSGEEPEDVSQSIKIFLLLTALSLAPSAIIMTTSFMRIFIVLGITRRAIGAQSTPPGQILAAIALFLTIFIMMPVFQKIHTEAIKPYMAKEISAEEAWEKGVTPLKMFMYKQTGEKEIALFLDLSRQEVPSTIKEVSMTTLIPSFMLSELKTSFQMAFLIYLPFLVIDLVIASSLMSLGMMMLPPMMISLPIKILFFILADGWTLLIRGIVTSFSL